MNKDIYKTSLSFLLNNNTKILKEYNLEQSNQLALEWWNKFVELYPVSPEPMFFVLDYTGDIWVHVIWETEQYIILAAVCSEHENTWNYEIYNKESKKSKCHHVGKLENNSDSMLEFVEKLKELCAK